MIEKTMIRKFLDYCRVECGFSLCTLDAYKYDLLQFELVDLSINSFQRFLVDKGFSQRTCLRKWATIRSFLKFCIQEGTLQEDVLNGLPRLKRSQRMLDVVCEADITMFLDFIFNSQELCLRDKLLFELLYATGIRVSECVRLQWQHVDFIEGQFVCSWKGW
jgi:Site-specific recombinase XerD